MYDLKDAYLNLKGVLDKNMRAEIKDFWSIYFHFWRYLYCLNQNIEESSCLLDKVALIEEFISQHKDMEEIEAQMIAFAKVKKQDVPKEEIVAFCPHIEKIKDMYTNEQGRLAKLMREVKKEKVEKKEGEKKVKKRPKKQKWMRT